MFRLTKAYLVHQTLFVIYFIVSKRSLNVDYKLFNVYNPASLYFLWCISVCSKVLFLACEQAPWEASTEQTFGAKLLPGSSRRTFAQRLLLQEPVRRLCCLSLLLFMSVEKSFKKLCKNGTFSHFLCILIEAIRLSIIPRAQIIFTLALLNNSTGIVLKRQIAEMIE